MMTIETRVQNKWALSLRGLFLTGVGFVLFKINQESTKTLVLVFAALILLSGISGIFFSTSNNREQIRRKWLIIESAADIVFSIIALYFYLQSISLINSFITAFAFFSMAFAFMQFIYIFQIAEIGLIANMNIVIARAVMAVGYGLIGVILIYNSIFHLTSTSFINIIGIGPLAAGIAVLTLSHRMYKLKGN